jgi:gluconate 2-dehydrogenase gamma chain
MNRREAIQQVAWLMGGAISAPALVGVLNGCTAKPTGPSWKPELLTGEQALLVSEVAELMIPRTETPGAQDVGVPAFIDKMLKDVYTTEDQQRYVTGLAEFDKKAHDEYGNPFVKLDRTQRMEHLRRVHDAAVADERALQGPPPSTLRRPFVLMTKELSLLGFFTSKEGATQVLQYVAVPGGYKACIPVAEAGNGKTWALETSTRF